MSKRQTETVISTFFVAGLVFSDYADAKLKRGVKLTLVAEPTNVHDSRAIKVLHKGVHIGWVPRDQTHEIHGYQGPVTRAVLHAWEPQNVTHRRALVTVFGVREPVSNVIC